MRKIKKIQITIFCILVSMILVISLESTGIFFDFISPKKFGDIIYLSSAVSFFYIYSILFYRIILKLFPIQPGLKIPGSREEFVFQINLLFYLMIFNSLIRTNLIPVPLMRFIYLALGADLGRDTYSAGALLDPPLIKIGDSTIIGHNAVIFSHVIEGDRFELHTVRIGGNVTIGSYAVIMPGVEIKDRAIVSAGAVVTKGTHIGEGEIWGGVPARKLSERAGRSQI